MCKAVFILNGFVSITSKMHQIDSRYTKVDAIEFVILQGVIKFIIAGILLLFLKKYEGDNKDRASYKKAIGIVGMSAFLSGLFSVVQLSVAVTCRHLCCIRLIQD